MGAGLTMLDIKDIRGKRVTVMGLGLAGGGVGSAGFFARRGADVTVTDLRGADELSESVAALKDLDITFHLGGHPDDDFSDTDMVVASPAVRIDSSYLVLAASNGIPVECPLTLFFRWCPVSITGVTGTLGKTTITALVGCIMSGTGKRTWVGGNIGENPLNFIDEISGGDAVILEISSFQLEYLGRAGFSPHIAVITGITPDHMDRYSSMAEYISSKKNILRHQKKDDIAFINAACDTVTDWAGECTGTAYTYSTKENGTDVYVMDSQVFFKDKSIASLLHLRVPGEHNRSNAAVAAAVSNILGAGKEAVDEGISAFKGVDHRMEYVAGIDGIRFYDDSSATTPEASIAAIHAMDGPSAFIIGGYDKGLDMSCLVDACVERVEKVVLIGASTKTLMEMFRSKDEIYAGRSVESVSSMEEAVKTAAASLERRGSVLLSPAYASFDMFRNYRDRGDSFKKAVYSLPSPI